MMEFIPNPHKIEHPAGVHMLDNQSRITLWQTEPAALLYAQMLQGCLREYAGLTKEVVVIGSFDRAEIWDAGRWAQVENEAFDSGELESAMAEMGL